MSTTPTPPPAQPAPQGAGLTPNVAGGLAYVTFIPAIIFLVIEPFRRDSFVRFHSFQSIFLFVASVVVHIIAHFIPFIGWAISGLISLVFFIIWLIAIIKAFQGQKWSIPLIGPLAEQQAASGAVV